MDKKVPEVQMLTYDKPNYYAWVFTGVVLASLVLWLFSVFCSGVYATQFDIFFQRCITLFSDFTSVCCTSSDLNPYSDTLYGAAAHAQPPLAYIMCYIFSRIIIDPKKYDFLAYMQPQYLIIYVIMVTFAVTLMYAFISSHLRGSETLKFLCGIAITFCGPMLMLIERGNLLYLSILSCLIYCVWYDSADKIKREIALFCLSFAFAIKLTPCVFGVLLLADKRYKDALKAAIYGLILFIVPFLFLEGGLGNIPLFVSNVSAHLTDYGSTVGVTLRSVMYGLINPTAIGYGDYGMIHTTSNDVLDIMINIARMFSAVIFLLSSFMYNKKWQIILSVSLIVVITPKVSGLYNVLYLIPSLIFFLNERVRNRQDVICLFAYSLMCCVFFFNIQINYHLPVFILYLFMLVQSLHEVLCHISNNNSILDNKNLT